MSPAQPKTRLKHAAAKPRAIGKQYIQAHRDRRHAARDQPKASQHAAKAPKADHRKSNTNPPVEGKLVFIPKQRDLPTSPPRRITLDAAAPPSYLTAQTAAVSMLLFIIAVLSAYALMLAKHTMNYIVSY